VPRWFPSTFHSVGAQCPISAYSTRAALLKHRSYWFAYKMPPPIPTEETTSHSTNVHVIPASAEIASRCKSLRTGTLVHLSGNLVEASGHGLGRWRSSLSCIDTGDGACDLMRVNEMSIRALDQISRR
jgi:hypothetical protein